MLTPEAFRARGAKLPHAALPEAKGVSFHSARVKPGDAFFALPGAAQHGIAYAEQALRAGAAFVVSDRPHPRGVTVEDPAALLLELGRDARRRLTGPVIGITGSAGKTSCKALLSSALGAASSPGNFNTPLALAEVLVGAARRGETRLVLELGIDHPGEMDVLVGLAAPTHAVLTLIAPSHLSQLGDLETVAREKLKLVDGAKHAFVSAQAAPFMSAAQRAKSTTYGLGAGDVTGVVSEERPGALRLEALGVSVELPFAGRALAENALAALAVAAHIGVDLGAAAARLREAQLEPGRLQVHRLGPLTVIDDSYNSNPASAAAALEALAHFPQPHSAVLGDMLELGAASAAYHRELGLQTRHLETVIALGSEMKALAQANPNAHHLTSYDLETLQPLLPKEGTLLIKGSRGTRLERLVAWLLEHNVART